MSEVTKVVSAENAPINNSMNYAKKYEASYEESGGSGEGGTLVCNLTWGEGYTTATIDKTYNEILEAVTNGKIVWAKDAANAYAAALYFSSCDLTEGTYYVNFLFPNESDTYSFEASSADGVMTWQST